MQRLYRRDCMEPPSTIRVVCTKNVVVDAAMSQHPKTLNPRRTLLFNLFWVIPILIGNTAPIFHSSLLKKCSTVSR